MRNRLFFFLFSHPTVMLCAKPWKQRESDNWETKAFQYSVKPNIGALAGNPLAHNLRVLPCFILGLNKVGRIRHDFPAWDLRYEVCRANWLPWNGKLISMWPVNLEGEAIPAHVWGSPAPGPLHGFSPYLLGTTPSVSHSILSSRIQIRSHLFEKPNSKGGLGALH